MSGHKSGTNLLELRIDLDAVARNTRALKESVDPAQLMAVVKADAYNHVAVEVARTVLDAGADQLGVATLDEAHRLREAGVTAPVLAWIWSPEQDVATALDAHIDLAVISPEHARAIIDTGRPARVTVKVETGMHRSGVDEADWGKVFAMLRDAPQVTVTGLMSHLACGDVPGDAQNNLQVSHFRAAIARARTLGLEVPVNHLTNSPGTLSRPDLRFEMVRPGAALYGLETVAGVPEDEHGLEPAMSWVGRITVVKPVAAGEGTSYGMTWRAPEDGYLAVVPAGYADGLPRAWQGRFGVTVRGRAYPQVGRVCMDQHVIFLGDNPDGVALGDEAVIFGAGGVSATRLAEQVGTINYEVVSRPTGRTRRVFVGGSIDDVPRGAAGGSGTAGGAR